MHKPRNGRATVNNEAILARPLPRCMLTAVHYADRGWRVFPAPPGKKKSHKSAEHSGGKKWGATTDSDEIRNDFTKWPAASVGIPTGAANGFWVLDADTLEGHGVDGLASLRTLEAEHGELPATLQARSPTGSVHYYFRYPEGIEIRNTTSKIAPGLDVRGEGGMVLAPPSLVPGRGSYAWINYEREREIADAPPWLLELATAANTTGERTANVELTADETVIAAAMAVIPNDDDSFDFWNRFGLAIFGATDGSAGGFKIFDDWSRKWDGYDANDTADRWASYETSPPDRIGAGTIFHLANEACPGWRNAYDDAIAAQLDAAAHDEATHAAIMAELEDDEPWPPAGGPQQRVNGAQPKANEAITSFILRRTKADTESEDEKQAVLVRASDVVPRAKNWLWPGHLLRGGLELLTGLPGLGKSQVQCSLVACVSARLNWPDGAAAIAPMNTIMVTAEDALDQEVVPRLIAAGANLERVHILKSIKADNKRRQFLLAEDLDELQRAIKQIGDVGLITIDPITAYMGGKMDSHKSTEVRSQLGPLKDFAEQSDIAVSAITHPAKNAGHKAIDHFIGSQAFIAAARIGHAVFEEIGEEERPTGRILFTNPKNNPSPKKQTLAYRIAEIVIGQDPSGGSIASPHVVWDDSPVDISADAAIAASGQNKGTRDEAQEVRTFLKGALAAGPRPQEEIVDEGGQLGFTERQLKFAKRKLGVTSFKEHGVAHGAWYWQLPEVVL
jgi:hypothetical protein